jgi:hypothetical protein
VAPQHLQSSTYLALTTPIVVTGKVTSIEKDTVDATDPTGTWCKFTRPNAAKVAHKIAVVKIDKALVGAEGLTNIKIGFVPPLFSPKRPYFKVNLESLFFLAKHPTADFYVIPDDLSLPMDIRSEEIKEIERVLALVAEPLKGLKSAKADVRLDTAMGLIMKYRTFPLFGVENEQLAIPADESKLILKALAETDWKIERRHWHNVIPSPHALGLTDKDGWKPPMVPQAVPGAPPVDFVGLHKDAFVKWLAGPGKDYVIKKVVAKPAK